MAWIKTKDRRFVNLDMMDMIWMRGCHDCEIVSSEPMSGTGTLYEGNLGDCHKAMQRIEQGIQMGVRLIDLTDSGMGQEANYGNSN